jgi:hypothetical protein
MTKLLSIAAMGVAAVLLVSGCSSQPGNTIVHATHPWDHLTHAQLDQMRLHDAPPPDKIQRHSGASTAPATTPPTR